jgi:hypothetical protein
VFGKSPLLLQLIPNFFMKFLNGKEPLLERLFATARSQPNPSKNNEKAFQFSN